MAFYDSSPAAEGQLLRSMIDAALQIHSPYGSRMGSNLRWVDPKCRECETRWPCRTVAALTSKVKAGPA